MSKKIVTMVSDDRYLDNIEDSRKKMIAERKQKAETKKAEKKK